MKKSCLLGLVWLICLFSLYADGSARTAASDKALLFELPNLLQVDAFGDGFQSGAGGKLFLTPDLAGRALLAVDFVSDEGISDTTLGLGLGVEWHPARGKASPYFGGLTGIRTLTRTGEEGAIDFYFGGLAGVEVLIFDKIAVYAEYKLLAIFDANGFSVKLGEPAGGGRGAQFGIVVYF
ncbi:MAG: hypothetical protein KKI09_17045 [Spirochaetes bacterium]|nr:hypothetical protein [Spirochaetota bacterium]MBU0957134.1 hypothetical protein [Spirochaetota bacterium]